MLRFVSLPLLGRYSPFQLRWIRILHDEEPELQFGCVLVPGEESNTSLRASIDEVWLGDNAYRPLPVWIELSRLLDDCLIGNVVISLNNSEDDRSHIRNIRVY